MNYAPLHKRGKRAPTGDDAVGADADAAGEEGEKNDNKVDDVNKVIADAKKIATEVGTSEGTKLPDPPGCFYNRSEIPEKYLDDEVLNLLFGKSFSSRLEIQKIITIVQDPRPLYYWPIPALDTIRTEKYDNWEDGFKPQYVIDEENRLKDELAAKEAEKIAAEQKILAKAAKRAARKAGRTEEDDESDEDGELMMSYGVFTLYDMIHDRMCNACILLCMI